MRTKIKIATLAMMGLGLTTYAQEFNQPVKVNNQFSVFTTPSTNGQLMLLRDTAANGTNQSFGGLKFSSASGYDFVLGKFSDVGTGKFQLRDQNNTAYFTVLPGGNFGIGTAIPYGKLDVTGLGVFRATDNSNGLAFMLANTQGNSAFTMRAFTNKGQIKAENGLPLELLSDDGKTLFYGQNGGNVGIGTTSPKHKFHIEGDHNNSRILLHSAGGGSEAQSADLLLWASEPGVSYSGVGIGNNVLNASSAPYVRRISTQRGGSYLRLLEGQIAMNVVKKSGDDLNALSINDAGNMGVGIAAPTARLHVNDGKVLVQPKNDNDTDIFRINEYRGGSLMSMSETGDAGVLDIGYYGLAGDKVQINGGVSNQGASIGGFDDGVKKFNLNSKGDSYFNGGGLAVGTTSLGGYQLAVNGKIRAKEIKVETGWADFVFYEDYQLPSLEAVEQHIKEKGHLEHIPSEKEVAENGIYLGEMDSKLLRKIEELTLYTIQQEKKIKSLQEQKTVITKQAQEIENLKKQNAVLKSLLTRVAQLEEKLDSKK